MRFHDVTVLRDALIQQYCDEEFDRRLAQSRALIAEQKGGSKPFETLLRLFSAKNW
jgi:hypothetical protein